MKKRPNILLFFTDDQRHDTIGALGTRRISTPNLDALAARGTAFTRAHIPGGTCGAVCMPSRAMLHTGRTLFHIGREGQDIPENHLMLGECLRAAGYDAFGTGKWHNGRGAYARSFDAGGEIFFGGMEDHWNVPAYRFDPSGRYTARCPFVPEPTKSNTVAWRGCDHITVGRHSTDLFTGAALKYLRARDRRRPFFAYVSLMAPHDPRTMPEKYLSLYDPDALPLPGNFLPGHPFDTGELRQRDELLAAFPRDPAEIRRHIAEYYAMISHLDAAFGRLQDALRESGELNETIIVFAGDNGLALGQHGLMGKQNLYEHSVRVPLVFAGPGIPAGCRRDDLVYLLDIYPTLCDLVGIARPASVEGATLAPALAGSGPGGRETLYLAFGNTMRGVTDGRRKLIEYSCGRTQLFDLAGDPEETRDLSGRPPWRETVFEMRRALVKTAAEWDDQAHHTGAAFWGKRSDLKRLDA